MNNLRHEILQMETCMDNNRVYIRKKYRLLKMRLEQPKTLAPIIMTSTLTGYLIAEDKTLIELLALMMRMISIKRSAHNLLQYVYHAIGP